MSGRTLSDSRVSLDTVHCGYFAAQECRSCARIEWTYERQLAAKAAAARAALPELPESGWLPPVRSELRGFRNKAKMAVGGTSSAPTLGLVDLQLGTQDLSDCLLYPNALRACFAPLKAFIGAARIAPYDLVSRRGELKFILLTHAESSGELMLRLVLRSTESIERIRRELPALRQQIDKLTVISANLQPIHQARLEGPEEILLSTASELSMPVNTVPLRLRPGSFFQTNTAVAAALYRQARDWLQQLAPASVWDLYCGVGGFALHAAAAGRQLLGVESSAEAVTSARRSAAEMRLTDVEFVAADVQQFIQQQTKRPELVIVNPPRRGLGRPLCEWLQLSGVESIIYSSCNAESLSADLALLPGYQAVQARLLDMFAHSPHYELITLLRRRDSAPTPSGERSACDASTKPIT